MQLKFALLTVLLVSCACAQAFEPLQYEPGADIGYGFYRNESILSPEGSIDAGIRRFAAGIILGVDFSKYVSGELNFLYHDGHPSLLGLE